MQEARRDGGKERRGSKKADKGHRELEEAKKQIEIVRQYPPTLIRQTCSFCVMVVNIECYRRVSSTLVACRWLVIARLPRTHV
jgi:hypothetical protein